MGALSTIRAFWHVFLARGYHQRRELKEASSHLDAALALKPTHPLRVYRAMLHLLSSEYTEFEQQLRGALTCLDQASAKDRPFIEAFCHHWLTLSDVEEGFDSISTGAERVNGARNSASRLARFLLPPIAEDELKARFGHRRNIQAFFGKSGVPDGFAGATYKVSFQGDLDAR